jgi:prepilin signal peptidase PulO-like enzyme (type II secretory pathway)
MNAADPVALLTIAFFFLCGAAMGSFGNVLIARLPAGETLGGRSHCPWCLRALHALELIPIASWLWLRAKCSSCRSPISAQYPLVEIASMLLFGCALLIAKAHLLVAIPLALSLWLLLVIAIIDAKTMGIPDLLSAPFAVCAILATLARTGSVDVLAPLLGFAFFGAQWALSRGYWVGSGDIVLSIGIGFLLGRWELMLACLLLSYILGAFVALWLLVTKRVRKGDHVPFGPFLAAAAFLTLLFGDYFLPFIGFW